MQTESAKTTRSDGIAATDLALRATYLHGIDRVADNTGQAYAPFNHILVGSVLIVDPEMEARNSEKHRGRFYRELRVRQWLTKGLL